MREVSGDAADILVGGRYRRGELLGKGGMSSVWRATDELLGREVALKRVPLGLVPSDVADAARERTMREARIAAALHHPNVVTIFDVVIEDGEPWLVLEYLPSRSLGAILMERGTLTVTEVAAIGAQVAAGLAAAHAAGIVHRDVKPDNILLTSDNAAKLTDFGISRAAQSPDVTAAEILSGTPAYLAPEVARGGPTDPRTDVYALGATLYAAIEGHPPFGSGDGNVLALLTRVGQGNALPPAKAGPLTGLISDLVGDDADARPAAAVARRQLQRVVSSRPRTKAQQVGRPAQRLSQPVAPPANPTMFDLGPAVRPPAPPPRRQSIFMATMLVIAALVIAAVTVLIAAPAEPEALPAAAPTSAPVPAPAGAVSVSDPRAADPCAMVDTAALRRHGKTALDPDSVSFAGCQAVITTADDARVGFVAEFESPAQALLSIGGTPEQIGRITLVRYPAEGAACNRRVMLSDGNGVRFSASGIDVDPAELCAIADTGANAAVSVLASRGVPARSSPAGVSPLALADACSLLGPAALAPVPDVDLSGRSGFANWSCEWASSSGNGSYVRLAFTHRSPLGSDDGRAADFAGRPGRLLLTERRGCFAQFGVRDFQGAGDTERIDAVQLFVYRQDAGAELCDAASVLATAVAGKLSAPA